jgi:hypothetical protein
MNLIFKWGHFLYPAMMHLSIYTREVLIRDTLDISVGVYKVGTWLLS